MRFIYTTIFISLSLSQAVSAATDDQLRAYEAAKAAYISAAKEQNTKATHKAAEHYLETAQRAFEPWDDETTAAAKAYGQGLDAHKAAKLVKAGLRSIDRNSRLDHAYINLLEALGWNDTHKNLSQRVDILVGLTQLLDKTNRAEMATPYIMEAARYLRLDPHQYQPIYMPKLSAPKHTAQWGPGASGGSGMEFAGATWGGCVKLSFTVGPDGLATNPKIVGSQGSPQYKQEALELSPRIRYIPKYESGQTVATDNVTYIMDWTIHKVVGKNNSIYMRKKTKQVSSCTLKS
ncbi:energy transducer TonB [Kordiimonas marina]|uniref:energy transducer TonB n=1 Tax=Kordiimonas marina TaxID=2872312 RepID=UPI001FF63791|nr:energy transducer TonB [Kordiimonas marina]MCJ9427578.1 energy transducer TonB [Kordiimonas marina]